MLIVLLRAQAQHRVFCKPFCLLLLTLLAAGVIACDPGHEVIYENRTNHTVTVFRNSEQVNTVMPFESKKVGFLEIEFNQPKTIIAKDENGRVLYSQTLTWQQLEQIGWKIVITEPDS